PPAPRPAPISPPTITDRTDRFPLTNLDMQVGNYGTFARSMGSPGVIYPRGSGHSAVLAAGGWLGGLVAGDLRLAMGEYSETYSPGPMLAGGYLPDRPEFRN